MDATMLTVVGTGIGLFVALWKVQGRQFDTMDRRMQERFEAVNQRFDVAEQMNRERFEMAENRNRERFEMAENQSRERFEMAERQNQAAHAAICESLGKLDDRVTGSTTA